MISQTTQAPSRTPPTDFRPAQSRPGAPPPPRAEGIRDTIESIVVAFILAFVFRAFLVEAFVIPTGSMAPGLFGKHAQQRCSLCGYSFAYGIKEPQKLPSGEFQAGTLELRSGFTVTCPNCGWSAGGNADLNTSAENRVVDDSGDRILVLKWPYDIGGDLLGPKRWDVVVFKNPEDGDTNYIKRLIGLPGEVLEIIDGDIYAAPLADVPEDIRQALSKPPAHGDRETRRLSAAQHDRLLKLLKVQRKTRIAQQSLWIPHYHHDYVPRLDRIDHPDFIPPAWRADETGGGADWDAYTPVVTHTPNSDREGWLRLTGKPIQDEYGYNDVNIHPTRGRLVDVGDVRLHFVLFPRGDSGHLILNLRRGPRDFRVRIGAKGDVQLDRAGDGGIRFELARAAIPPLRRDKGLRVEFENVDYRVSLRIDDREIMATDDSQYAPDLAQILSRPYADGRFDQASVAIAAKDLPLEIRHLAVDRDVFYRSDAEFESYSLMGRRNPYAGYRGWATANNPILLRASPGDYFCCGDNSPQSKDSRLWWEQAPFLESRGDYQFGTVPADQMIGRAFFVYWPGGYRLSKDTLPVVPNVGRMRIIR